MRRVAIGYFSYRTRDFSIDEPTAGLDPAGRKN